MHGDVRYQDPFEDYKARLARKLARQAESDANGAEVKDGVDVKLKDDVNWFGVKLGSDGQSKISSGAAGVGKYLNLASGAAKKRPFEPQVAMNEVDEDYKKRRKIGFGNFDSW